MQISEITQAVQRLPRLNTRAALALVACCLVTAVVTLQLRPTQHVDRGQVTLSTVVPPVAGSWREVKSNLVQMSLTPDGQDTAQAVASTYDDTAMTSYVNPQGDVVMVALAYGRSQRQEGKIHRPELCYSSQGFEVAQATSVELPVLTGGAGKVLVHRLEAVSRGRREIVSYWIRIGDLFSTSAFETRTYILRTGLQGRIPDGILFRVSQIVPADLAGPALEAAFERQEGFMSTLANTLTGGAQQMLLGDRLTAKTGVANATS